MTLTKICSDILAELDLPQSYILALEDSMPWPYLPSVIEQEEMTQYELESYIAQLYLRKQLNHIHKTLYAPGKEESEWPLFCPNKNRC